MLKFEWLVGGKRSNFGSQSSNGHCRQMHKIIRSLLIEGVAILSNAPEPKKSTTEASKKPKKLELENASVTSHNKKLAPISKGVRPVPGKKANGASPDDVTRPMTAAQKQQVN